MQLPSAQLVGACVPECCGFSQDQPVFTCDALIVSPPLYLFVQVKETASNKVNAAKNAVSEAGDNVKAFDPREAVEGVGKKASESADSAKESVFKAVQDRT